MTGKALLLIFLIFQNFLSCSKSASPTSPSEEEINQKLDEAFAIADQYTSIKSLVVVKDNNILKEKYSNASGYDVSFPIKSVTKSIMALLIGIAIDKGIIDSVNQSMSEYLTAAGYKVTADKAKITIKHLLTMSSGLPWAELNVSTGEYSTWTNSPDQVQYMLDKNFEYEPGTHFNYNSGASHLLSVILTQAAGMSTADFAQQNLFEPLGVGSRNWSKDKKGYNYGSSSLSLSASDMIKIGKLILNEGLYEGKRVISSEWMKQATNFKITTNNVLPYHSGYGYCFWMDEINGHPVKFGMGWAGQFLAVVPDLNLIVIAINNSSGIDDSVAGQQWMRTVELIMTRIIPAFE